MGKELVAKDISKNLTHTVPAGLIRTKKEKRFVRFEDTWMFAEDSIGSKLGILTGSLAAGAGSAVVSTAFPLVGATGFDEAVLAFSALIGFVGGLLSLLTFMDAGWDIREMRNSRLGKGFYHGADDGSYDYKNVAVKTVIKPSLWSMLDPRRLFMKTVLSQYVKHDLANDTYTVYTCKGSWFRITQETENFMGDRAVFKRALSESRKMKVTQDRKKLER